MKVNYRVDLVDRIVRIIRIENIDDNDRNIDAVNPVRITKVEREPVVTRVIGNRLDLANCLSPIYNGATAQRIAHTLTTHQIAL